MEDYICEICDFTTSKNFNYERHLKSKKHKEREKKHKLEERRKKSKIKYICEYCGKEVYDRRNLNKHYDVCLDKKVKDLEKEYSRKEKEREKEYKKNLRKKDNEYRSYIDEIEKDYRDIIKNISPKIGNTINNTINYNSMNMYYIMKNFNDALDYDKIMNDPITDDEKKMLRENNSIDGCYKLIKGRCIDNINIDDRPIHCVDIARLKFMIHTNNEWMSDIKGHRMLESIIPKVYKTYRDFADDYHDNDMKIKMIHESINLINNKSKVINRMSTDTELKSEMQYIG